MNNSFNELAHKVVSLGLITHKRIEFMIKRVLIDDVLNQPPKLSNKHPNLKPFYPPLGCTNDDYQTALALVYAQLDIMLSHYNKKNNIE